MKYVKRILLTFSLLCVLLAGLIVVAPFTGIGSRLLLDTTARIVPLDIEYVSGALFGGLRLKHLVYHTQEFHLELQDVKTRLETGCLGRSMLCFSQLDAEAVEIRWTGGLWRNGPIFAQLAVTRSQITVEKLRLVDAHLEVESTEDQQAGNDPMPGVELPIALRVNQLEVDGANWRIGTLEYSHSLIRARGQWRQASLQLEQLDIENEGLGLLQLAGQLQLSQEWPFSLAASASWESENALADILDWPADYALSTLPGAWTASARGNFEEQQFSVRGALSTLGYEALQLEFNGSHTVTVSGSELSIDTISLNDSPSDSAVQVSGTVTLAERSSWQLSLESRGFAIPAISEQVSGRLHGGMQLGGHYDEASWKLMVEQLQLQGEINGTPAHIKGQLGLTDKMLLAGSKLSADLNDAQLNISGLASGGSRAKFTFAVDDIDRWVADAQGALELSGELDYDLGGLSAAGSVSKLLWQGLDVDSARLNVNLSLVDDYPFTFELAASHAGLQGVELENLDLRVFGDTRQHILRLQSAGDVQGILTLEGKAVDGAWQGKLTPAVLNTPTGQWQLKRAVAMNWNIETGQLMIDGHCWRKQNTKLCPGDFTLTTTQAGTKVGGSVKLAGETEAFGWLMPPELELKAGLELQSDFSWSDGSGLIAKGNLNLGKGYLSRALWDEESARFHWDTAQLRFDYSDAGMELDAGVNEGGVERLKFNVALPSLKDGELSGELRVNNIELGLFQPFFPALSKLHGELNGRVSISGSAHHPIGRGEINLLEGMLEMSAMPTKVESMALKLLLNGDEASIQGSASVGGGTLDISGVARSSPEPTVKLRIQGNRANLVFPPSIQARVSHDLTLLATPEYLSIKGSLVVHDGLLEHEELAEGGVGLSDDIVEVDMHGEVPKKGMPFDVAMDVKVAIENKFRVVGSIVDVTVGGDLQLLQEQRQALQLFGNLNVIGGEVRAYNQRLKVKRGSVSFSGPLQNPGLDMRAERTINTDNVTVGLKLRGTMDAPELDVYSDPVMSRTEILSYLLRGRGLDTGAAVDGTALALSMGTSLVNQSGVFAKLDKLPGINSVELSAEGSEGDTTATISGYIGRRIYLSYGVGLYEPINILTARLYLKSRLWLEVVSSLENSLDLYYSFDIE